MTRRFPIVVLAVLGLAVSSLVAADKPEKKDAKKAAAKPVKLRDITLTVPPTWQQQKPSIV